MICAIDDDECLGSVEPYEGAYPLCQFHVRVLCEIGQRGFEEWYSIELEEAQAGEAGTAETTKIGSVHEHAVGAADAPKGGQP